MGVTITTLIEWHDPTMAYSIASSLQVEISQIKRYATVLSVALCWISVTGTKKKKNASNSFDFGVHTRY